MALRSRPRHVKKPGHGLLLLCIGASAAAVASPPPASQVSGGYPAAPMEIQPRGSAPTDRMPAASAVSAPESGIVVGPSTPGEYEVVDPEHAFRVDVIGLDAGTLGVRFSIADCCYLYRDKTRFSLSAPDGAPLAAGPHLAAFDMPPGESIADEFFGRTEIIYRDSAEVPLPLGGLAGQAFALNVTYQGCSEKGVAICYEPMTRRFPINSDGTRLVVGPPRLLARAIAIDSKEPARDHLTSSALAVAGAFGVMLVLGAVVRYWQRRRGGRGAAP